MSVDDGSGVVSCVQWRKTKDSSEGIYLARIGQLVSVLGQVDEFRDERQLRVTAISEFVSHRIFLQNFTLCPIERVGVMAVRLLLLLLQSQRMIRMQSHVTGWRWSKPGEQSIPPPSLYLLASLRLPARERQRSVLSSFSVT